MRFFIPVVRNVLIKSQIWNTINSRIKQRGDLNDILEVPFLYHHGEMIHMEFLEGQFYTANNLLSYRTRVESSDLSDLLRYVRNNLDVLELKMNGRVILNISEKIAEKNKQIYGVEILIPVDKEFESTGQYVYKPTFKLVNAISYRFYGNCGSFAEAESKLSNYIKSRDMNAVTGVYYILHSDEVPHCGADYWDTYIAVNENIV